MFKNFLLLMFALAVHAQALPPAASNGKPLEIVNLRMQRYNERRIDAMLELYSDDVRVYAYPDRLLGTGKQHMRRVLEDTLKDSTAVTLSHQLEIGRYVVSEEKVSYAGRARRSISIYEVEDGLIRSVRFIRD